MLERLGKIVARQGREETGTRAAAEAAASEAEAAKITDETEARPVPGEEAAAPLEPEARPGPGAEVSPRLIARAVARLIRAGGRKTEADAAHLLEGIAVIAYEPGTGTVDPELPAPGGGLRWEEFVDALAKAYEARFEA